MTIACRRPMPIPEEEPYISVPDIAFQKYLIEAKIDSDGEVNGKVLLKDVENIQELSVGFVFEKYLPMTFHNLTGVESFPNLKKLTIATNIDSLDIAGCKNLTYFEFRSGSFVYPQYINFFGANNLKELKFGFEVDTLGFGGGPASIMMSIKNLDLSSNLKLEKLVCSLMDIESIDLSKNINLQKLNISYCKKLQTIKLPQSKNLKEIGIWDCPEVKSICLQNNESNDDTIENAFHKMGIKYYSDLFNYNENLKITKCE